MGKSYGIIIFLFFICQTVYSQDIGVGVTYFKDSYTLMNISLLRNNSDGSHFGTTLSMGSFRSDEIITSEYQRYTITCRHYGIGLNLVYGFSVFYLSGGTLLNIVPGSDNDSDAGLLFHTGVTIKPFNSIPFSFGINFLLDKNALTGFTVTVIF